MLRKNSLLREKCLSIVILFALAEHVSAQKKKPEYFFSKKLLGDKKLIESKKNGSIMIVF